MYEMFNLFNKCYSSIGKYKAHFLINMLLNGVLQFVRLVEPWIIALIIDALYEHSQENFLRAVASLIVLTLIQSGLSYSTVRLKSYITRHVNAALQKDIFTKLMYTPPTALSQKAEGNLFNVVIDDSSYIIGFCYTLCSYILDIVSIITIGGILLCVDFYSFLCAFGVYPLIFFLNKKCSSNIRKKNYKFYRLTDSLIDNLKMYLFSGNDIKTNAMSNSVVESFNEKISAHMSEGINCDVSVLNLSSISSVISLCGNMVFYLLGGFWVLMNRIEMNFFITYASYAKKLSSAMYSISTMTGTMQKEIVRISRYFEIDRQCSDVFAIDTEKKCINSFNQCVELNHVSLKLNRKQIFEDINLSFEKGSLNALVGANGTGKTSILNLICGIYSNTSGTISIDSNSIEELKRDSIIQLISYVMQIPVIYRASIIENLIMPTENRMVCMDKIIFLCKSFGLYEDILNLPEGFHTYITESYKLSAGQQKKIQLVRCILRDTPILLLDEPFANLDYGTKKAVISILKEYARTHLVIIATHDQETLTEFDKIYRMEDIVGTFV